MLVTKEIYFQGKKEPQERVAIRQEFLEKKELKTSFRKTEITVSESKEQLDITGTVTNI